MSHPFMTKLFPIRPPVDQIILPFVITKLDNCTYDEASGIWIQNVEIPGDEKIHVHFELRNPYTKSLNGWVTGKLQGHAIHPDPKTCNIVELQPGITTEGSLWFAPIAFSFRTEQEFLISIMFAEPLDTPVGQNFMLRHVLGQAFATIKVELVIP